ARAQVVQVHVEHPLAVGQIERIEAPVVRHAALVQEGPHRPVAKEGAAREARAKRMLRGRHRVSRSSGPPHVVHGCEKSRWLLRTNSSEVERNDRILNGTGQERKSTTGFIDRSRRSTTT